MRILIISVLDVPIDCNRKKTYEDFTIITPEERTKALLYGQDFGKRLEEARFEVTVDEYIASLGEDTITYHGLERTPIYVCTK